MTSSKNGRPPKADRQTILRAARVAVDKSGADALSLRKLAADLELSTTAVYHHFPTKNDLYLALLADASSAIDKPLLPDDPRERIIAATDFLAQALGNTPWIIDLIVAGHRFALKALWIVDEIIENALVLGASDAQSVELYSACWRYALGEALAMKARSTLPLHSDTTPQQCDKIRSRSIDGVYEFRNHWSRELDDGQLDIFPTLKRLAPHWESYVSQYNSTDVIRSLVDGLLLTFREQEK